MPQWFRIAMVSAGETGTPLRKQLLSVTFVTVIEGADINPAANGSALVRDNKSRIVEIL